MCIDDLDPAYGATRPATLAVACTLCVESPLLDPVGQLCLDHECIHASLHDNACLEGVIKQLQVGWRCSLLYSMAFSGQFEKLVIRLRQALDAECSSTGVCHTFIDLPLFLGYL